MHRSGVLPLPASAGPLSKWDPRAKLLLLACYLLTLALLDAGASRERWLEFGFLTFLLLAVALHARARLGALMATSCIAIPFAAAAAFSLLIRLEHPAIAGFPVPWTDLALVFDCGGLAAATQLVLRAWLALFATLLLVASTPVLRLLQALEQLRVPGFLILLLAFVVRHLFLLRDQLRRTMTAARLRSGGSLRTLPWGATVPILTTLFVRTIEKGERTHRAMLLRGFSGAIPRIEENRWTGADSVRLILGGLCFASVLAAAGLRAA